MKFTWQQVQEGVELDVSRVQALDFNADTGSASSVQCVLEAKPPALLEAKPPALLQAKPLALLEAKPLALLEVSEEPVYHVPASQLEDLTKVEPEFSLDDCSLFDELELITSTFTFKESVNSTNTTTTCEYQTFHGCLYSWNPNVCDEDAVNYLKAFTALGFVLQPAFYATPALRNNIFYLSVTSAFQGVATFPSEVLIPVRLFKSQNIWRTALIQMLLTYHFLRNMFRQSEHKSYVDSKFVEVNLLTVKVTNKSVLYTDACEAATLLFENFVKTL